MNWFLKFLRVPLVHVSILDFPVFTRTRVMLVYRSLGVSVYYVHLHNKTARIQITQR